MGVFAMLNQKNAGTKYMRRVYCSLHGFFDKLTEKFNAESSGHIKEVHLSR